MRSGKKIFVNMFFSKKLNDLIVSIAFSELASLPPEGRFIPVKPASPR